MRNYIIIDHFNSYGISKRKLQENLNKTNIHEDNNRLLVFNAPCKLLVTIRIASKKTLKDEIDYCISDINMLLLMFRDELETSGVIVTGLVVYQGKNLHQEINCCKCQHFIVSREVFESVESMNNFWKEYKEYNIFKKIKERLPKRDKEKDIMIICRKILPYLASYQYQVCDCQILPTLEEEPTRNIAQAELLLDRYQMEIAHSRENRIILKGNYGTGKTIICLKKMQILSAVLRDMEIIYYINFQGKSELDIVVSKKVKQYPQNINVMRTTVEINTLVEITQEYLNEKFNLYTRNIASSERLLEKEVLQNPNIGIHANLLEDESAIADSNTDANLQKDDLVTKSSTIQNFVLDHNSAISENAPIGVTQKASNSNSYVDFDELHKLTSTEVRDSGEHCQKRETKYR